jgi:hypothetical protein
MAGQRDEYRRPIASITREKEAIDNSFVRQGFNPAQAAETFCTSKILYTF